ncbi:Bifunctional dihydrofolate reductase-thymidylate synthase [Plasmodiophora brassicae]
MAIAFEVIAAFASGSRGIGVRGGLPWRLPADLRRFKRLTTGSGHNAVIMGRNTWQSIPEKFRPLPGRINIVLTRDPSRIDSTSVKVASSLTHALRMLEDMEGIDRVFVIGGEKVYADALKMDECHVLHLTRVLDEPDESCDAFFPDVDWSQFMEVDASDPMVENDTRFEFLTYVRRPYGAADRERDGPVPVKHDEDQYLDLVRRILDSGVSRTDRTGVGTVAVFGAQMRFDLRNGQFPLLTTKRVFWRGVAEELLWFISGCTDGEVLSAKGIRIWDGNGSREFLDRLGFHDRRPGDLGPVYGFQWRHFGAKYATCDADYAGQGIDQLAQVIEMIKTQPDSRRIIMTAWNPSDLHLMVLPPCHMFCQFFVNDGELSCLLYQRSCDMGLGVPFNIASYALLTRLIAHVCGLKAGELIHTLGDAHVYMNHVDALKEQLKRTPRPFPTLTINSSTTSIDGFKFEDVHLDGYNPYPAIKMDMAV